MRHALDGVAQSRENWLRLQAIEQQDYRRDFEMQGNYLGHFSEPEIVVTEKLARILSFIDGPVLDVGCGVLPMPNYLKLCKRAMGIDPYYGECVRAFPFAQAVGEHLPFDDGRFAAVTLMSSLDHAREPMAVLRECWRVLRRGGKLIVWYISRTRPDIKHPFAFQTSDLITALSFGFGDFIKNTLSGNREIGYPRTELLIGKKIA